MAADLLDGRVIDAIIVLVAIEGCVLVAWRAHTGRGPSAATVVANLLAGASLLLALRVALTEASAAAISTCLAISFAAHGVDLAGRWRAASPSPRVRRQPIESSRNTPKRESSRA
jgi:hypothetical protein